MIKTKNPDVVINDIDFAADQEPDLYSGATLVRVNYTISNGTLSRMLGKQSRVLSKYLSSIGRKNGPTRKQIINKLTEEPNPGDRMSPMHQVMLYVSKFVKDYIRQEFNGEEVDTTILIEEESDLPYSLVIDPEKHSITLETEFGAEITNSSEVSARGYW